LINIRGEPSDLGRSDASCSRGNKEAGSVTASYLYYFPLLLLQDGGAFFVGDYGALEVAEGGGLGGGNLYLADDVIAFVVEEVALGRGGGVVAGEVEIEIYGVGGFVDYVARGNGDVEAVAPMTGVSDFDGVEARLSFHDIRNGAGVGAEDAGTDEEERAGGARR
jgi:hypothetical protein